MASCSRAPAHRMKVSKCRRDHGHAGQRQSRDDALEGDGARALRDQDCFGDRLQAVGQDDDVGGLR